MASETKTAMDGLVSRVARWPPIVWPAMTVASLLILGGASGAMRPRLLIAGAALALAVFALSLYLATRRSEGAARPRIVKWAIGGTALFYILIGAAASTAGPEYGIAGLAAGIIPMTALCLLLATMRSKTVDFGDGLEDRSGDAHDDPYPGIGMDQGTPLGDSPEHSPADLRVPR